MKAFIVHYCASFIIPSIRPAASFHIQKLGRIPSCDVRNHYILFHHNNQHCRFMTSSSLSSSSSSNHNNEDSNNNTNIQTTNKKYKKTYQISGIGTKSHVIMKTNTGHTIETDVPKSMGGNDNAPQPVETLLAAWMGCTQATALFVGRNMNPRVYIDKIEFDSIEAYRDERGALGGEFPLKSGDSNSGGENSSDSLDIPARLECVSGVVKVYAVERKRGESSRLILSDEHLRILGEQSERRCPVANMMALSGCTMKIEWINGDD